MPQTSQLPVDLTAITRVLRCRNTGRYFTGEGWTENPPHAQPFPNEEEAVRACVSHHLQNMELVLRAPAAELSATPIQPPQT